MESTDVREEGRRRDMPGGMMMTAVARSAMLLAILGGAGEALAREPMMVVLRSSAPSVGPFVRLSEIADIPNDPFHLREYAGAILLGLSPGPDVLREIEARTVEARLREAGIAEDHFSVRGASKTTVFCYQNQDGTGRDHGNGKGRAGAIPGGGGIGRTGPAGRFLPLSHPAGGAAEAGRSASPQKASFRRAAPAMAGESTRFADQGIDLSRGVEKGDRVIIRIKGRALILEEPGKAQENARPGQIVEVLNQRSGKKMLARLIGDGVVEPAGSSAREGKE